MAIAVRDHTVHLKKIHARSIELIERGWCRGAFIRGPEDGRLDIRRVDTSPYEGEIRFELEDIPWHEFPPADQVCSCCLTGSIILASNELGLDPNVMVTLFGRVWQKANGNKVDDPCMPAFNDDIAKTPEEIIASLRRMEEYL